MIRIASEQDIPQLKHLFKRCFNDTDDFLNLFFTEWFPHITGMVAILEKQIASMLFLCPVTIQINGKPQSVFYTYACGTHPQFRGKGLMKSLLQKAFDFSIELKTCGLIVSPASKPLWTYYEKLGFTCFSSLEKKEILPIKQSSISFNFCEITPDDVFSIRAKRFAGDDVVSWDETAIQFSAKIAALSGGGLLGIRQKHEELDYLLYEKTEDTLHVKECSIPESLLPELAAALQHHFSVAKIIFHLRSETGEPFAMIRPTVFYKKSPNAVSYFNLEMG